MEQAKFSAAILFGYAVIPGCSATRQLLPNTLSPNISIGHKPKERLFLLSGLPNWAHSWATEMIHKVPISTTPPIKAQSAFCSNCRMTPGPDMVDVRMVGACALSDVATTMFAQIIKIVFFIVERCFNFLEKIDYRFATVFIRADRLMTVPLPCTSFSKATFGVMASPKVSMPLFWMRPKQVTPSKIPVSPKMVIAAPT